ncbi:hypothetical protein [Nakamurella multipartita]|nr:hypothetical protein [Nakamurella multipartita]
MPGYRDRLLAGPPQDEPIAPVDHPGDQFRVGRDRFAAHPGLDLEPGEPSGGQGDLLGILRVQRPRRPGHGRRLDQGRQPVVQQPQVRRGGRPGALRPGLGQLQGHLPAAVHGLDRGAGLVQRGGELVQGGRPVPNLRVDDGQQREAGHPQRGHRQPVQIAQRDQQRRPGRPGPVELVGQDGGQHRGADPVPVDQFRDGDPEPVRFGEHLEFGHARL